MSIEPFPEAELKPNRFDVSKPNKDLTDSIPLAISMLEECDRWACEALTKYIHKISMLETALSVDDVYQHQQKIRIVIKKLKGGNNEPMNLTFEDIDKLHESWDKEKHKHLIEYVADTLKCKIKDVPLIYMDWCVAKANALIAEEMEGK